MDDEGVQRQAVESLEHAPGHVRIMASGSADGKNPFLIGSKLRVPMMAMHAERRLAGPAQVLAHEELLRARGLRVTRPRLAVLEILGEGGHLEVDEIATRVRDRLDSVSTQAVYDVLGALARAG